MDKIGLPMQRHDRQLSMALVLAFVVVLTAAYAIDRAGYWPRALTTDNGLDCPPLPEVSQALARRDYDQAIRSYTEVLAKTFSSRDAACLLRDRAHAKEQISDTAGAEADWNEAIRISPTEARLYSSRGFFYLGQKHYDLALADFEHGRQIAPRNSAFPYGLGRTYASQGKLKDAVEAYSETIRLAPEMYTAFRWRAKAYRELHMDIEAARDDERAQALEKKFWDAVARTGAKPPKGK
ncbi:tetratricopeptide repeat protein [Bradyrhizobium sp. 186]|uniref:tetratricopeptide repeat protein n=1 Tax=Bradyrhizobium sp. 186 TaxID=2782654 RepID=UPI0020016DAF|nr:tetratricopeptide repeat protein [Bradyrhizobium sp. 186]UPK35558.1 tetratricopeptide repeat protein [Bradyrhizobium sp. 186]